LGIFKLFLTAPNYLPNVKSFLGVAPEKDERYVCDDKEQIEKLRLFLNNI